MQQRKNTAGNDLSPTPFTWADWIATLIVVMDVGWFHDVNAFHGDPSVCQLLQHSVIRVLAKVGPPQLLSSISCSSSHAARQRANRKTTVSFPTVTMAMRNS